MQAPSPHKTEYARSFGIQCRNLNPYLSHPLVEEYEHGVYVIQNPPAKPLTTPELDEVYELPYARAAHPMYDAAGGIPAIAEVKFSLASNRGCLGECSFCALNFHQGRIIQARSDESLVADGHGHDARPRLQGLHQRRWRPHGRLHAAHLPQAGKGRRLRGPSLPCARALPQPARNPRALRRAAAQAPRDSRRQEGLHPQRHPV